MTIKAIRFSRSDTIPARLQLGNLREFGIGHLFSIFETHELPEKNLLFGFILPAFQRKLCWSRSQEIKFIESAWLGLPLGTYTYHEPDFDNDGENVKYSYWLLDGQQRLTALLRYFSGEFQVYGSLFPDLAKKLHRRFLHARFPAYEIALWDEIKIKEFYNRMNFGGTAHKPSEVATC